MPHGLTREVIKLALPRFRHSVHGGACPPSWNGLRLPIGVQELPNWVLGSAHGLRASAWALGVGFKTLFLLADCCLWNVEVGGRSPRRFLVVTRWGLSVACRILL